MTPLYRRLTSLSLCQRCPLGSRRKKIVIGRGDLPADILFIGEAPGRTEDLLGEPFVGSSGRLLQTLLSEITLPYFITNTVLCRPCDKIGGENRAPKAEEVIACRPNIELILRTVKPRLAILLGKIPQYYCADLVQDFLSLHHPSFILRSGGLNSPYYLPMKNKLLTKLKEVFNA